MYSNWMYGLAGFIAERISGSSWEDLIQKHYFTPLGMDQAGFFYKTNFSDTAVVANRLANGSWTSVPLWQLGNITAAIAPAGAICTSSSDFLKYMKFLLTQNSTKLTADQQVLLNVIHDSWKPSNVAPYEEQGSSPLMFKPRYKLDNIEPTYGFGWFQGVWRGINDIFLYRTTIKS